MAMTKGYKQFRMLRDMELEACLKNGHKYIKYNNEEICTIFKYKRIKGKQKTDKEKEEKLRDEISQYKQKERRKEVWNGLEKYDDKDIISVYNPKNKNIIESNVIDLTDYIVKGKKEKIKILNYNNVKGITYKGKDIIQDHSISEIEIAKKLSLMINKEVNILPRITVDKVKSADFEIEKEKFDLKEIKTKYNSEKRLSNIESLLNKKQSENYIIYKTSETNLNEEDIIKEIQRIIINKRWIKDMIVMDDKKILKYYRQIKIDN